MSSPSLSHASAPTDVLLISMPFGPLRQPSIGLSLLKGGLEQCGVSVTIRYFGLDFAEWIGPKLYTLISNGFPVNQDLLGEWLFSPALFGAERVDTDGYIRDVLNGEAKEHNFSGSSLDVIKPLSTEQIDKLLAVQAQAAPFLDACVDAVLSYRPKIVGFTSIFQQHVASLGLAKRLKQAAPDIFSVFGGANCEDVMGVELIKQFPFVDAVVSGEGDLIFPKLVDRVLNNQSVSDLQGVYTQQNVDFLNLGGQMLLGAPTVRQMDDLPRVNYDNFFDQWQSKPVLVESDIKPLLLFETSRGCWWGEKAHCTFCGLNGLSMAFRSKSSAVALQELTDLTERYPGHLIQVVDNILDMKYFKEFVPQLAAKKLDLELFYEVKANLKKDQVQLISEAGITKIQPGIESFSDDVLHLMDKGVSGLQNIQLLKWSKEHNVNPMWNILWGFPGESPEDYAAMADLLPALSHLRPPVAAATIRLDRFSPNFDQAEARGFTRVKPYPAYSYVYPLADEAVANLAYFFSFDYQEPRNVRAYTNQLNAAIGQWKDDYATSDLILIDKGDRLLIWDLRPISEQSPLTVLLEPHRTLYQACDKIHNSRQLVGVVKKKLGMDISADEIDQLLAPLVKQKLMLKQKGIYLSLAVPLGHYRPTKSIIERLYNVMQSLGSQADGKITIATQSQPVREAVMA